MVMESAEVGHLDQVRCQLFKSLNLDGIPNLDQVMLGASGLYTLVKGIVGRLLSGGEAPLMRPYSDRQESRRVR
jgi:hypothetical protein